MRIFLFCIMSDDMKKISSGGIALLTAVSVFTGSFFTVSAADVKTSLSVKSSTAAAYEADADIAAYAVFGENIETKNMRIWMGDNNEPISVVQSGKNCWNMNPALAVQNRYRIIVRH